MDDDEVQIEEPVQLAGVDLAQPPAAVAGGEDEAAADQDTEDIPIHEPELALNEQPPVITLEPTAAPADPVAAPVSLHVESESFVSAAPHADAAADKDAGALEDEHAVPAAASSSVAAAVENHGNEPAPSALHVEVPATEQDHESAAAHEAASQEPDEVPAKATIHPEVSAAPEPEPPAPAHPEPVSSTLHASHPISDDVPAVVSIAETVHPSAHEDTAPAPAPVSVDAPVSAAPAVAPTPAAAPALAHADPAAAAVSHGDSTTRSAPRPIVAGRVELAAPEPSPFLLSPHPTREPIPDLLVPAAASGFSSTQSTSVAVSPVATPITPVLAPTAAPAPIAAPAPAPAAVAAPTPVVAAPTPVLPAAAAARAVPSAFSSASGEGGSLLPPSTGLNVTVCDPERIGDGFSSYMTYTVKTKTQLPQFRSNEIVVKHRYNDFFALFKYLETQYPGAVIPPPPPKDAISTGLSKFKSGSENSAFIERRGHALSRFMARIALHPILFSDDVLKSFLESGEKIEAKISVTPKKDFGEGDDSEELKSKEWFDAKIKGLELLDGHLKRLNTLLDAVVDRRKELAACLHAFVDSLSATANTEEVPSLAKALHSLADSEARIAKLHSQEAQTEFYDLSEIVADYLGLLTAIRTALGQRQQAQKDVQSAEATLAKKREAEAKAKPEKKAQATKDVAEAELGLKKARRAFHQITLRVTKELLVFDEAKIYDFKVMVVKYVESLIGTEEQVLRAWEQLLPEARAISV